MRIFLDANILISVLNKELPVYSYTARILSLADDKKFAVYTSPACLAIAYYFSEKKSGSGAALEKIKKLAEKLRITDMGRREVTQAATNLKVKDFEDAIQYYSAKNAGCNLIITQDRSGFGLSEIEVLGAERFFKKYLA